MDDPNVQVIRKPLWPEKGEEVQSFLGFANFYHHFIVEYSDMAVPLAWLTLKDAVGMGCLPATKPAICSNEHSPLLPFCTISTQYSRRSMKPTPPTTPSRYTVGTNGRRRRLSVAFYSQALIGSELN